MSLEQISRLRTLVHHLREQDDSAQLLNLLEARTQNLHGSIKLPELQSAGMLADFVIRYVEQVPNFIEAIADIALEAGIYRRVEPLLSIACGYFLAPPDIVSGHNKLASLLDEAYLAHRLLEEINDRFIGYCGVPLAPMDMTRANIIAHEIIGEPFANELDQAVLFSAELLLNEYRFTGRHFQRYISAHKTKGWAKEFARWPCLTDDIAIAVEFGKYGQLVTH